MSYQVKDASIVNSQFLKPCPDSEHDFKPAPFIMVIFGGSGDLSQKKLLPAIFHLFQHKLIDRFVILSIGRRELSHDQFRSVTEKSLRQYAHFNQTKWNQFKSHLEYASIDIEDKNGYEILCDLLEGFSKKLNTNNVLYYLSVLPNLVPTIVRNLSKIHLCRDQGESKVIIEKPFGQDQKSAHQLNEKILNAFDEHQIYRIDHYLGKETVQNILFFRFANSIFEPLWNRSYIDHIEITVAEDIGIGDRGKFYEETGVIRDIVQNHLLQLIALVTMEAPVGFEADLIRNEKTKVFRAMRAMTAKYIDENCYVAQYDGYRSEKNVDPDSVVPTYFEGIFYIDNWRWADVPIYVRTGKRLPKRYTEIVIQFKKPPLKLFGLACEKIQPNALVFTIQPEESISLRFDVKRPGATDRPETVNMLFNYQDAFHVEVQSAYERLLIDCMKGDQTLFARQDGVELMWSIVDPIIKRLSRKKKIDIYPAGKWIKKSNIHNWMQDNDK